MSGRTGDYAISILNRRKDAPRIRTRHLNGPSQAHPEVGYINQALLWEWPFGDCRQSRELSQYAKHNVRRGR